MLDDAGESENQSEPPKDVKDGDANEGADDESVDGEEVDHQPDTNLPVIYTQPSSNIMPHSYITCPQEQTDDGLGDLSLEDMDAGDIDSEGT